jgi:hypothetical protein
MDRQTTAHLCLNRMLSPPGLAQKIANEYMSSFNQNRKKLEALLSARTVITNSAPILLGTDVYMNYVIVKCLTKLVCIYMIKREEDLSVVFYREDPPYSIEEERIYICKLP